MMAEALAAVSVAVGQGDGVGAPPTGAGPLFGRAALEVLAPQLLCFCSARDILRLRVCCRAAFRVSHHGELWRHLFVTTFDVCRHDSVVQAMLQCSAAPATQTAAGAGGGGAGNAVRLEMTTAWESAYRLLACTRGVYFHFHEPVEVEDLHTTVRLHHHPHPHTCLLYTSPSPRDRG